ncbi:MAG: AraC family transcriptional regulator [Planctomycetes bacterium]|nr:AraC family transcriptional regulator [Planctomycetota bacterium]
MKPDTLDDYRQRVLKVLLHIQNHLDDPISLDELAGVAHFSPYHFHRIFRGMVGEGVMEHVRRLRLQRAAMQLSGSRSSVTAIALGAGYETHESFTRAFHSLFGQSPTEFRMSRGWQGRWKSPAKVDYEPGGRLEQFIVHDTGGKHMDAVIKRLPAQRVVFLRHVGPYHEVGPTWGRLCAWAGPRGLIRPDAEMLGLCHDDPETTPPEKIRYDACISVDRELAGEGDIGTQIIAGGDYAVTIHKGPFERLGDTYARLCGEWIPSRGREIKAAPGIEKYLNDPNSTPPAELLVEVRVPLA